MMGERPLLEPVRARMHASVLDIGHAEQVSFLSERLFDALVPLHNLTSTDRELLVSAALLHDIGWLGGRHGHHRRSCELIRADPTLPFAEPDRTIVALTARYHRRSLPDPARHPLYGTLDEADRTRTRWLGGLLRLADWLDRDHEAVVTALGCELATSGWITVRCRIRRPMVETESDQVARADLIEATSGRRCRVVWGEG